MRGIPARQAIPKQSHLVIDEDTAQSMPCHLGRVSGIHRAVVPLISGRVIRWHGTDIETLAVKVLACASDDRTDLAALEGDRETLVHHTLTPFGELRFEEKFRPLFSLSDGGPWMSRTELCES
jgi:hypothetical protein